MGHCGSSGRLSDTRVRLDGGDCSGEAAAAAAAAAALWTNADCLASSARSGSGTKASRAPATSDARTANGAASRLRLAIAETRPAGESGVVNVVAGRADDDDAAADSGAAAAAGAAAATGADARGLQLLDGVSPVSSAAPSAV